MEEQLVTFNTAKLAKNKGFTEITRDAYVSIGMLERDINLGNKYKKDYKFWTAPTQSFLQKWLRDIHKIEVQAVFNTGLYRKLRGASDLSVKKYRNNIIMSIDKDDMFEEFSDNDNFDTYEDALEEGLKKALKLI